MKANQKAKAKEKGEGEGEEEGKGEDESEGEGEPEGEGEGRRLMDNPLASCPTQTELIIFLGMVYWSFRENKKSSVFVKYRFAEPKLLPCDF